MPCPHLEIHTCGLSALLTPISLPCISPMSLRWSLHMHANKPCLRPCAPYLYSPALAVPLCPTCMRTSLPCAPVPQAVLAACRDELADVRQSGFALVGDLARGCVSHLLPVMSDVVVAAMAALAPQMITQVGGQGCRGIGQATRGQGHRSGK